MSEVKGWALKWRSENRLDGKTEYLMIGLQFHNGPPHGLFKTRQAARDFKKAHYDYIAVRPDLMLEPHGWKAVHVVKATLVLSEMKAITGER